MDEKYYLEIKLHLFLNSSEEKKTKSCIKQENVVYGMCFGSVSV